MRLLSSLAVYAGLLSYLAWPVLIAWWLRLRARAERLAEEARRVEAGRLMANDAARELAEILYETRAQNIAAIRLLRALRASSGLEPLRPPRRAP